MRGSQGNTSRTAFTLIELSIVLIIIGLIVGGILVGQDLMSAAAVRAQISQIEKFNAAVNTFHNKYGGIPGDLNSTTAAQFGFVTRAGIQGRGDGDGLLEGYNFQCLCVQTALLGTETSLFWVDLSMAGLIPDGFNTATDAEVPNIKGAALNKWLPTASLGAGNYIHVYTHNNYNYYSLIAFTPLGVASSGDIESTTGVTVQQAYNIDKKIDDGLPTTGSVTAVYPNVANPPTWTLVQPARTGSSPSTTTCYDTTSYQYSTTQNSGNGVNCALSFQFQ